MPDIFGFIIFDFNNIPVKCHLQILNIFFNYNTITNYILIIYELSNLDHTLGVVSQIRVSGRNQTHDRHANSLAQVMSRL